MSTPSDTIRTATSHGSRRGGTRRCAPTRPGRRTSTTSAVDAEARRAAASAMPAAWSWSMAMTRPPASGCSRPDRRASRSCAAPQHARQPLAVERQRGPQALARPGRVERVVERGRVQRRRPAPTHSMWPFVRGKYTGRTTPPSAQRVAVAVLVVGHRLVAAVASTNGIARVSERNGVPDRASRRAAPAKACRIASPQARSSPAWWISSRTTNASRRQPREARRRSIATCW